MNFPIFALDSFGSGSLVAVVAIIHVLISHGAAVGGSIMMVALEQWGIKNKDEKIDNFAYRYLRVLLIVTTSLGAMTGVGIWMTTAVVQPSAIGDLLRVFFWGWFTEWIVFMAEVALILIYYFTWKKWVGKAKAKHGKIGYAYAISSWLTMAIITGILAAMLTPGAWLESRSFFDAFFNPTYLPSLAFRTFVAIALASVWVILYSYVLNRKDKELHAKVVRFASKFLLGSGAIMVLFGAWYLSSIPAVPSSLIQWATALTPGQFNAINYTGIGIIIVAGLFGILKPKYYPRIAAALVLVTAVWFIGELEMVRESIRKPYVVYNYMYVNGIRVADVDRLNKEGILANSNFLGVSEITEDNKVAAGKAVFKAECQACHVLNNSARSRRDLVFRLNGWNEDAIYMYAKNLHGVRPFMPPFIGTDEELRALSAYLATLNSTNQVVQQEVK